MEKPTASQGINILQLPEEVIEEIISHVDLKSRRNLAPACRTLYKILCRIERDKFPLEITYSQVIAICWISFRSFFKQFILDL